MISEKLLYTILPQNKKKQPNIKTILTPLSLYCANSYTPSLLLLPLPHSTIINNQNTCALQPPQKSYLCRWNIQLDSTWSPTCKTTSHKMRSHATSIPAAVKHLLIFFLIRIALKSVVIEKIVYSPPAWCDFANSSDKDICSTHLFVAALAVNFIDKTILL